MADERLVDTTHNGLTIECVHKHMYISCSNCRECWKYTYLLKDKRGREKYFCTPLEHANKCNVERWDISPSEPVRPITRSMTRNENLLEQIDELKREKERLLRTIEDLAKTRGSQMIDARQYNTNVQIFNFREGLPECIEYLKRIMNPENIKNNLQIHPIELLREEALKYPDTQNIDVIINPDRILSAHNRIKEEYQILSDNVKRHAQETSDEELQRKIECLEI